MKKIIGLSTGLKNGNCEILLKEAAMGAEELGIPMEIIRAQDFKITRHVSAAGPARKLAAAFRTMMSTGSWRKPFWMTVG
ncbi:MAG TPA: hypothetical protein VJ488_05825 [Dehalococcoidia bacterium]|nr:hypothetical protein [Dehalococcoidia bacterium]